VDPVLMPHVPAIAAKGGGGAENGTPDGDRRWTTRGHLAGPHRRGHLCDAVCGITGTGDGDQQRGDLIAQVGRARGAASSDRHRDGEGLQRFASPGQQAA
jgi:hypothetical protein